MTEFDRGVDAAIKAVGVELRRNAEVLKTTAWEEFYLRGRHDEALKCGAKAEILSDMAEAFENYELVVAPNV